MSDKIVIFCILTLIMIISNIIDCIYYTYKFKELERKVLFLEVDKIKTETRISTLELDKIDNLYKK